MPSSWRGWCERVLACLRLREQRCGVKLSSPLCLQGYTLISYAPQLFWRLFIVKLALFQYKHLICSGRSGNLWLVNIQGFAR